MLIIEKYLERVEARIDRSAGDEACHLWTGCLNNQGYGIIRVGFGNNRFRNFLAHRLAWMIASGEYPADSHVLHRCDNPRCCNPRHLFLGTHQDNMDDCAKKARHSKKLTREQVREIYLLRDAEPTRATARRYGVSGSMVSYIQIRKSWRRATEDLRDHDSLPFSRWHRSWMSEAGPVEHDGVVPVEPLVAELEDL